MPHLVQMQEDYGRRGLQVLGITAATREETRKFVTAHSIDYPVLAEAKACQKSFGVDMIWGNVVFLVDPEGLIVADELEGAERRIAEALGPARAP